MTESRVLIIGAGLAGMTAAHYLAEWGAYAVLADSAPHIGGAFLLLDHTFTTDSCGLCIALPRQPSYCPTLASELHPHITPLTCTTLAALEGEAGRFVATLRCAPRYVDPDRCDNCGACAAACPATRLHPYDGNLALQQAIYPPPPRAVPFAYALDPQACTRCGACVDACPRGAIDLDAAPREERIEVGAVLLAPGFAPFDAARAGEFGWGRCANVVTNLQFERMLNRSGPTGGRVQRPSDGQVPRRIAFIHCVGSRNAALGRPYCSTSCCMITARQVGLVKEIVPEAEVTVYTMDVRTAGKGYEEYFQRVATLPGVAYRREMVSAVQEVPGSRNLRLLAPGVWEEADLLVLAVGLGPADGVRELAACAGVALDEHGFILPGDDGPGTTSRPGVFAAGAGLAPADVPETVTQAAAAAALAAQALADSLSSSMSGRDTPSSSPGGEDRSSYSPAGRDSPCSPSPPLPRFPASPLPCSPSPLLPLSPEGVNSPFSSPPEGGDERGGEDLADQPPRIGVFFCTCHGTLEGALDLPALVVAAQPLRGVAHVERLADVCDPAGLAAIERAAKEHSLNRIVVAGCSPRLYADRFSELMARLELPARLLARANVREGAAWPHGNDPAAATGVARGEVEMAVVALREVPYRAFHPGAQESVPRRVLVLGGGLAGMTAALALAGLGVECDLLERQAHLGGNLQVAYTLEGGHCRWLDQQALLAGLVERLQRAERVRAWTGAELVGCSGTQGDLAAQVRVGEEIRTERYGALIVATGAEPATTTEYLYGRHPRVVTQRELEQGLGIREQGLGIREQGPVIPSAATVIPSAARNLQSVVMIQCVGSRDAAHPYCSRVCCAHAIKNALALKRLDPAIEVSVLFRDVRTLGTQELYYQQARRLGVRFLRYEPPARPVVEADGDRLRVTVHDTLYDETVTLEAGLLALSTGIVPRDQRRLARMLGVTLDGDGFFAEAHPKLRPTDLSRPGIFVCGLAYGPRFVAETISQARAAALRAALVVARPQEPRADVATVEANLCSFCGLCVANCPYGARVLDEEQRIARVLDHLCQGCGVCVAVCPNGASRQPAFEPLGALVLVDAALSE